MGVRPLILRTTPEIWNTRFRAISSPCEGYNPTGSIDDVLELLNLVVHVTSQEYHVYNVLIVEHNFFDDAPPETALLFIGEGEIDFFKISLQYLP